ncbi:GL15641 [Drosophila persimilis]|uniref:GL15641 n=1 Tax=Drosophila persimilis TaxID=7234 RepID=B4IRU5_DROPE|nr:GL15641 [Drosophila persimilis]
MFTNLSAIKGEAYGKIMDRGTFGTRTAFHWKPLTVNQVLGITHMQRHPESVSEIVRYTACSDA